LGHVRIAPEADKSLHRSEMTRSAMSRHMQCSNSTAVFRNVDWPN